MALQSLCQARVPESRADWTVGGIYAGCVLGWFKNHFPLPAWE